jgi:PAS domain S-box-containing protein
MPFARSLSRRLALQLLLALLAGAAVLLAASVWVGQRALRHEHESASLREAELLEASLHNAMLQRDLAGLARLIDTLGSLPGLRAAALLEPGGQVRFASQADRLGGDERAALAGLCLDAHCGQPSQPALRWQAAPGESDSALRVVYPVRNRAACTGCHGALAQRPVNGVLVLDYQPMAAQQQARALGGAWLPGAGGAALLLLAGATAWLLRREVLRPVQALDALVQRMRGGDLSVRSGAQGQDELARLAQGLDQMAAQLQQHMAALTAQGAFLQQLVDASPDPMLVIGADHRIRLVNHSFCQMLGRPREQVLGQPCHRASRGLAEPCPVTMVACPLAECPGRQAPVRTVMALAHADGHPVEVEIHAAPLQGQQGEPLVLEVIRPLGEQLRFSQEQRLSAIGLLANGVAHEIHNPLASIRLALQSCLRGLRDNTIEQAELMDYLRLVDEQIDRCVHTTQRLMRLSQPSAELAQPVAVRAAVDDVLALLVEEIRRAGVRCVVDIQPPQARVLADESELRQVLVNLVQNAVHAMPQGGQLQVCCRPRATQLALSVTDTGLGIPAERLPLIFLPFFSRRADGQRGTGLGLAICKTLVEQRGGRLSVQSAPGQGSRFEVLLPDADAAARPPDIAERSNAA